MVSSIFMKIISETEQLLFQPKQFWKNEKSRGTTPSQLLAGYFLPLLLVVGVDVFLGELMKNSVFDFSFSVLKALREMVLFIATGFFSLIFINKLVHSFGGKKRFRNSVVLVVYSMVPMMLASVVTGLFPFLYVLDVLGFYSFYIFWVGAKELVIVPDAKRSSYQILIIVAIFLTFSILSIILAKLITYF